MQSIKTHDFNTKIKKQEGSRGEFYHVEGRAQEKNAW